MSAPVDFNFLKYYMSENYAKDHVTFHFNIFMHFPLNFFFYSVLMLPNCSFYCCSVKDTRDTWKSKGKVLTLKVL